MPGESTNAAAGSTAQTQQIKNVDADEAAAILAQNTNIVVLDVRTPGEYADGHIAGATNVDFRDPNFAQELDSLDKDKTYLVHCASGGRSSKTRDMMKKDGFESIYHLNGGLNAWIKAGKPVVK